MSLAPQQTNAVVFDTSIPVIPTGTLVSQDLTGFSVSATPTAASESTSSPTSTSNVKTASPLDAQAHGSGKNVGIAIGIAIAILLLVLLSTILIFYSRKRKQAQYSGKQTIHDTTFPRRARNPQGNTFLGIGWAAQEHRIVSKKAVGIEWGVATGWAVTLLK